MTYLLCFEFPTEGPFGDEAVAAYAELAADIAGTDGLVWKVWTEDPDNSRAGGVYLFTDGAAAQRYAAKHAARLASFGVTDVRLAAFGVNEELSVLASPTRPF